MTASTRTVTLQIPTESWVWGWGRSHRDHLHFEQGFSDPTFSCWGKETNHLPSHGWVKQPLYSRRAAAKPKAATGGVKQLSQDAAVISQGSPASSTNSITQPEWKCDPLAPGLLLWGSKAAYPWFTPVVEVSGAGAPQLCHNCPWLSSLTPAPTRPNQLWGILWAESWAPGLAPSSQWELGAGVGVHQLLLPTGDETLQNGGGHSHGLVVDFLTLSMHELMCSMFSLDILLSVPLIIHLLVITVPISKYREINKNT